MEIKGTLFIRRVILGGVVVSWRELTFQISWMETKKALLFSRAFQAALKPFPRIFWAVRSVQADNMISGNHQQVSKGH
jgi:hypothetical protein